MNEHGTGSYGLYSHTTTPTIGRSSAHEWARVREMPPDEYASVGSARTFLAKAANASEYQNVYGYRDDFNKSLLEQLTGLGLDRNEAQRLFPQTARRFSDYLEAFKVFGERTSSWISGRYGKDSDAMKVYKRAASAEFDASAAYRMVLGLRNVSAHGAHVINRAKINVQSLPDTGSYEELELTIDGAQLIGQYGSRVRAATAREIRDAGAPIEIIRLVEHSLQSCARIHSALFLSVESDFRSALQLLSGLWDEASNEQTTEVWAMVDPDLSGDLALDGMQRVRDFVFESARGAPAKWRKILEDGTPTITVEDVCEPTQMRMFKNRDGSLKLGT